MRTNILVFSILISLISCEKKTSESEPVFDKEKAITEIKKAYYDWGTASKNRDIPTMYRLSYPSGNFEGMTENFSGDWNNGATIYLIFSSLNVSLDDQQSATVDGIVDMIQGPNDGGINGTHINFKSYFMSSAVFYDGKWLLSGFNGFQNYQFIEDY